MTDIVIAGIIPASPQPNCAVNLTNSAIVPK
jgi:hypothetical protein